MRHIIWESLQGDSNCKILGEQDTISTDLYRVMAFQPENGDWMRSEQGFVALSPNIVSGACHLTEEEAVMILFGSRGS